MTDREFNRYIRRVRPKLLHFASSFIGKGAATAEDMVQDAIMKVWRESEKGLSAKRKIDNIDALTITILRNVCLDYLRLKKNRVEDRVEISNCREDMLGFAARSDTPQEAYELKERICSVQSILETLPIEQQMVIRLRDVMGYEFVEIAQMMNISEGNVRTMLSRGRKMVREQLTNY